MIFLPSSGNSARNSKSVSQSFKRCINFLSRCSATEAEADGAHARFRPNPHRFQDGRELDTPGVTSRTCRGGDPLESGQYLGTNPADEGHIERVRQALRRMSIELDAVSKLPL